MKLLPFGYREWIGDVRPSLRADFLAGLTLWALIVPEAVAHANLAKAPSPMAGLYGIVIVLPIYALFASSRYVVATSTAAVSATMAGFIGSLSGSPENTYVLIVMATALVYLAFYFLRMGFITRFISEPVSRGFMFGLAVFIIVDQSYKLFGVKQPEGDTLLQVVELARELPKANWITFALGVASFAIIVVLARISERIPGGLIAMTAMIALFYFYGGTSTWDVRMVGALPAGLPQFAIPTIDPKDLPTLFTAAAGLVILGASESQVLAENLARKHGQRVDGNQQFYAFGISNLVGSLFGGHLGSGSTTSTMVDHESGAKTPVSTLWAALGALLTALFLAGVFAYVPSVFLAVLIIHALIKLLDLRGVFEVRDYSRKEFALAVSAALGVMVFGVLDGLLITMLLNVFFLLAQTATVKLEEYGYARESGYLLVPRDFEDADLVRPRDGVLVVGATQGVLYYVSAADYVGELDRVVAAHPDDDIVVMSLGRTVSLDFTAFSALEQSIESLVAQGKTVYVTNIHSSRLDRQLKRLGDHGGRVHVVPHLDVSKL